MFDHTDRTSSSQSFYSTVSEDCEDARGSFDYLRNSRSPVSGDGSDSETIGSSGSPVFRRGSASRQHTSEHPSSASRQYYSANSERSNSSARTSRTDDDARDRSRDGVGKGKGKERDNETNSTESESESELLCHDLQDCIVLGFIKSLETIDEEGVVGLLEDLGAFLSKTKKMILRECVKLKFGPEIDFIWETTPKPTKSDKATRTLQSSADFTQPARINTTRAPTTEVPQPQPSRRDIGENQLVKAKQSPPARTDAAQGPLVKYRPPSPVETNGTWVVAATAQSSFRGGSSRNIPVRTAAPPRTEAVKPLLVEAVRPPQTGADTARTLTAQSQSPPTQTHTARQITQPSTRESTQTLPYREFWSRVFETTTDRDPPASQYPRTAFAHNASAGPSTQLQLQSARAPSPEPSIFQAPLARIDYPPPRRDIQSSSSETEPDREIVQWQIPRSIADTVPTAPPEPEIDMSYVPRVRERARAGWKPFDQKRIMGWYRNGIGRNVLVSYGFPSRPLYEIVPGNDIGSHNLVNLGSLTPLTEKQRAPGAGAWDRDTKVIGVGRSGSTKRPVVWVLTSKNEWISKTLLEKRVGKYSAESQIVRCARGLADWYRAQGYQPEADHYLNNILDIFGGINQYEYDDDESYEPNEQPARRPPSPPSSLPNYYQTQLGQQLGSQSSDPDPPSSPPSYFQSQWSQQLNLQWLSALPGPPQPRSSYSRDQWHR